MKAKTQNCLTLKWGVLKSWNFTNSKKGQKLLKEYEQIDSSYTPRQKEIVCELIDLCDGDTILLEWYNKYVTKQEAKDYVMNYNKNG